jgi:hypothetical protein
MSGNRSTTRRIYQGMKLVEHWCLAHSQRKQIAGARPRLFRVLSLVDLEGFAYREVAKILDNPVGSTVMAAFTRFARRWPVASRRSQCR